MRRLIGAAAAALGLVLAAAPALGASSPGYHSPGYRGDTHFRDDAPAALPSIPLGTGKYPNLIVDGAGTAHVVFARDGGSASPDTLFYCSLQRGIKQCAQSGVAPNPQAPDPSQGGPFSGNFPGGNHDFDGPVPLAVGNQLTVIERRFPDQFPTPAGGGATSESNVFEWTSSDGGATLTGPGTIGDNQMAGGAVAYGDPSAPSIGTISRTETGGTFFQGSPSGQYTTAKAQLGTGDQAYYGELAVDPQGFRPVAVFADLTGHVFVREFSGSGDPDDASNWSETSFNGYSPQIVGGPAGVFVLSSDSRIGGGRLTLRRVVGGQLAGRSVSLGRSAIEPAVSEDSSGRIAFAYTDRYGVWTRTSTDGATFTPAQFTASVPAGTSIDHLVAAATADGGGFVSFVRNPKGAEGVGTVVMAAFGTQQATHQAGLGPLPGGGVGSSEGDQLATSTCQSAKFGAVDAEIYPVGAGCFAHDPKNPNLDVTLGALNLNGLRIIPDPGVRIGIDPRRHTIDTTGKVKVVLVAGDVEITLWHDVLSANLQQYDGPGDQLFDLHEIVPPLVKGFPIDGDADIKLADGGVDIPISLKLPKYFGGVDGTAVLHATTAGGFELKSLAIGIGDANLAAVELKDVHIEYTHQGNVWKGDGSLWVPAGGDALRAHVSVEFDDGDFQEGSLLIDLPYPGVPLDDSDPPPQLYINEVGLGFKLRPITLSGHTGLGLIPLKPVGEGSPEDFAFRLIADVSAEFANQVTIRAGIHGFLYDVELGSGQLTYVIPDQVSVTAKADFKLGELRFKGDLGAVIDARHDVYGARIDSRAYLVMPDPFSDVPLPGDFAIAVNNKGFGAYVGFPGVSLPIPPFTFFGSVTYRWGDSAPDIIPGADVTGQFTAGIPQGGAAAGRAHAAGATSFTVPAHAPSVSLKVHGDGGPPQVALVGPGGRPVAIDNKYGAGQHAEALSQAANDTTYVTVEHPTAGAWTVQQAAGSTVPIARMEYAIGQAPPSVRATVTGRGLNRTLRYRAKVPRGVTVTFAEQGPRLMRVIGRARGASGTIRFHPASPPSGRRRLVAQITDNGLPYRTVVLASYTVPRPPRPGRARRLHIRSSRRTFTYSFTPPANAAHTLIKIVATDGRHLQRIVSRRTRGGSVAVVGFHDGVTVTVIGLGVDGSRGPAVSARLRRKLGRRP